MNIVLVGNNRVNWHLFDGIAYAYCLSIIVFCKIDCVVIGRHVPLTSQ